MAALPRTGPKPFRFIYVSGVNAERDKTKKPLRLGEYCELQNQALGFALSLIIGWLVGR